MRTCFSLPSGQQVRELGSAISEGALKIVHGIGAGGLAIGAAAQYSGRKVYQCVLAPVGHGVQTGCSFAYEHKGAIAANIIVFALIIVFCGSMYGFKTVALPMVIGIAPGLAFGGLVGLLAARVFSHKIPNPQNSSTVPETNIETVTKELLSPTHPPSNFLTTLQKIYATIPTWISTVLLALGSSVFIAACMVTPYAAGAVLGICWGAVFIYSASNKKADHNLDLQKTNSLVANTVIEGNEQNKKIQKLESQIGALSAQLFQLQESIECPPKSESTQTQPTSSDDLLTLPNTLN